ncbi:MAG: hypothetical protein PUH99_01045 [Firmicutes bacterium]|nr:hypothetical protein [Bacillota bacterium]MDY5530696.1 hypothetical protein [Pumilibacteraceae bacterium]
MSVFYEKKESYWWFLLGFFVPVAGIVLYFVFKNKNLARAKKCMYGVISIAVAAVFIGIVVGLYYLNMDPVFRNLETLLAK